MHFKGLMIAVQTLDGEAGKKRRAKAYLRTHRKVQTYEVNSVINSYNKFCSGYLKSLCMKTANKLIEYKVHSFEFKQGFAVKVHLCSVIASFFVCGRLRNFNWRVAVISASLRFAMVRLSVIRYRLILSQYFRGHFIAVYCFCCDFFKTNLIYSLLHFNSHGQNTRSCYSIIKAVLFGYVKKKKFKRIE